MKRILRILRITNLIAFTFCHANVGEICLNQDFKDEKDFQDEKDFKDNYTPNVQVFGFLVKGLRNGLPLHNG